MPTIIVKDKHQKQWTHGDPAVLSKMFSNGFLLLQDATTKQKNEKSLVDGVDVSPFYLKVLMNIDKYLDPKGASTIRSPTQKDGGNRPIEYSALLGAYFRAAIKGKDGEAIVQLNDDQLQALYKFVEPLVPANSTPQQYLEGLKGSPSERHKHVLKEMLFHGVTPEEREAMFKEKYKVKVDSYIDSMLSLADLMRTPFSVLDAEENAEVAAAKKAGRPPKISAIDQQWASVTKAVNLSLGEVLAVKKGDLSEVVISAQKIISDLLQKCNGSFGIANERYIAEQEFAKANAAREEDIQKLLKVLGDNPDLAAVSRGLPQQLAQFQALVLEVSNNKLSKTDVEAMSFGTLIGTLVEHLKTWLANKMAPLQEQIQIADKQLGNLRDRVEAVSHERDTLREQVAVFKQELAELREEKAIKELPKDDIGVKLGVDTQPDVAQSKLSNQMKLNVQSSLMDLAEYKKNDPKLDAYIKKCLASLSDSNPESLKKMQTEAQLLAGIAKATIDIVSSLRNAWWFKSSGAAEKADGIEKALRDIPVESRTQLLNYEKYGKDNSSAVGKFVEAVSKQRLVITTEESTSMSKFKEHMMKMKASHQVDHEDSKGNAL